ncbi:hypothetical protein CsSME_00035408 [Camellia sinensis var. sinensis]|uniref:VQ domain-containing protein n=1 Tax=Camellia sinensis TaxID=4442 RepID=A0A7J7GU57_CAMSI|nr:hypothetical protein HYC85_020610 [Camellia sinensis]
MGMDSCNSGSMQSSSGGDEEYDSRPETLSPFLNPSLSFNSISNHPPPPQQPPPPHLSHHHQGTFFDPQSQTQNLNPFSHSPQNPNPNNNLYNLDAVWSRSDPNYTDLANLIGLSSSSSPPPTQSILVSQKGQFQNSSSSSIPLPSNGGGGGGGGGRGSITPRSNQTTLVNKNSRKRTRASRRAPTTVLATDTSNFRQMVQEFTGIPAPPFQASPYSRLDLFAAGSALSIVTTTGVTNNFASASNGYQVPHQNMQNPSILSFQNLLQSPLKYPLANASVFGSKSQGSSEIPSIGELGMSRERVNNANLGGFLSHGSSDGGQAGINGNLSRWRGEEGASKDGGQELLGSFDGNNSGYSQNVSNSTYKLNC